uniref:Uncharacterized protein n=1 Tax=Glossina austeni TaxID=7395 RepID=A0A1A9UXS9_GLOAU
MALRTLMRKRNQTAQRFRIFFTLVTVPEMIEFIENSYTFLLLLLLLLKLSYILFYRVSFFLPSSSSPTPSSSSSSSLSINLMRNENIMFNDLLNRCEQKLNLNERLNSINQLNSFGSEWCKN